VSLDEQEVEQPNADSNGVHSQDDGHPKTQGGDRAPEVFTSELVWFPWNLDFGLVPDFLDPGIGAEDNPFIINTIPEPATAALLALGGWVLLGRWHRVAF